MVEASSALDARRVASRREWKTCATNVNTRRVACEVPSSLFVYVLGV